MVLYSFNYFTVSRINLCKRNFAADSQIKNKKIKFCGSVGLCPFLKTVLLCAVGSKRIN